MSECVSPTGRCYTFIHFRWVSATLGLHCIRSVDIPRRVVGTAVYELTICDIQKFTTIRRTPCTNQMINFCEIFLVRVLCSVFTRVSASAWLLISEYMPTPNSCYSVVLLLLFRHISPFSVKISIRENWATEKSGKKKKM